MLTGIHVKDMALIREAEVDLSANLNMMTGETGAGKSILIGAVNAALGARISKDVIRTGAGEALTELFFSTDDTRVLKRLKELDIPAEDGQVVIARRITPTRSVSRINGQIVNMRDLQRISELLVDIHGQHEHQSLLSKQKHLEILDRFADKKTRPLRESVASWYDDYTEALRELEKAQTDEQTRKRDMAFMAFEIEEIDQADLTPGEDEALEAQYRKMAHARQIMEGADTAYSLTGYDQRGAGEAIGRALRALEGVAGYDDALSGLADQLSEIDSLLNDFNRELAGYMSDLTFDEQAFYETERRLDLINGLKGKYGRTIGEILAYRDSRKEALAKLDDFDSYAAGLRKKIHTAEVHLKEDCAELSRIRRTEAQILTEAITAALKDLNFLDVRFDWEFLPTGGFTRNGTDDVQILIAVNPGEPLKPLTQIVSGGEMSRIMLAIKSVLASADEVETLIFDEIDTGISGRTAQKVSEKLAAIARVHQVICITHLPQIAAMADSHYRIEKAASGDETSTRIQLLDMDGRTEELARMLGGAKITDTVSKSAREMLDMAEAFKSNM